MEFIEAIGVFSVFELLSSIVTETGLFTLFEGGVASIQALLEENGVTALYEIVSGSANDVFIVTEIQPSPLLKELFSEGELAELYKDLRLDIQPLGSTTLKGFTSRIGIIAKNIIKNGSYKTLQASKIAIKKIVSEGVEFAQKHAMKAIVPTIATGGISGTIGGLFGLKKIYNSFKKEVVKKFDDIDSHLIDKNYVDYETNNFCSTVQN